MSGAGKVDPFSDLPTPKRQAERPQKNNKIRPRPGDPFGLGAPPSPKKSAPKTISLEIKLPKLRVPKLSKLHLSRLPIRKFDYKLLLCIVGILILAVGGVFINRNHKLNNGGDQTAQIQQPDFKAAVPIDKPELAKVQGATSTYDPEKRVLSYTDTFMDETFTVSQQVLPDNFKTDAGALDKLVSSLGPKKVIIDTNHGPVYVSTNPKTNEQIVVFTTDKLLIFIRSSLKVEDTTWKEYINKLNLT